MKCKRTSDGRSYDHHTLQIMRQQAVKAVRGGQPVDSVAATLGVNKRSVFRWVAAFINGGQNALLAKPIPGRPPKLSHEQLKWIADAVHDKTPQQFRFEFGLWTLALIRQLVKRQFGVDLSTSAMYRVMKVLGFSAQKPKYRAWQQDAVLVRTWETETFPAILRQAKKEGATVYFADESGIRSDYHRGTTWAPKGETPLVEVTGRRFSLNMISAISPSGKMRFMINEGTTTAKVFIEFLKRLLIGTDKPVFLIVDGHPTHKSKMVKEFVNKTEGKLQLFFLPPYAPQLNPDEVVWAHVKHSISKRLVQSKEDMKELALSALRRIQKLPELVKSFFRQPECLYIKA